MKPRHIALGAALVVAAGFAIFGDKSPKGELVEPVSRSAVATPARAEPVAAKAPQDEVTILRLQPRLDPIDGGAEGGGAFASHNWTPPPPPPPPAPPPPAPSAPPLPFTYIGKAQEKGAWEVFLARGNDILIVRNQMVLDGVYRIDAVAPPFLKITYLPLNQVQQLNIGVAE
jgi:hypothetical protein